MLARSCLAFLLALSCTCYGQALPSPKQVEDAASSATGSKSTAVPGKDAKSIEPFFRSAPKDTRQPGQMTTEFRDPTGSLKGSTPPVLNPAYIPPIGGTYFDAGKLDLGAAPASQAVGAKAEKARTRSDYELMLSVAILGFGLVLCFVQTLVILVKKSGWGFNSSRVVVLTLVITAGMFLVTAGYSETQISPMMALLGTIVGYLLSNKGSGET